ncbi:MAG TPA: proline--tRNA ligase [Chloroflexia bacterium]
MAEPQTAADDASSYVEDITDKSDDFSRWYTDVVLRAELADYSPVRGCMVIRPYGYTLWENVRDHLDVRIKRSGCVNAYFPLLIPKSFLEKEAEHVEGFAPQVAWVTKGGEDELAEPYAIRPTSEAIIGYMYAKWIQSYRDLPLLINQWANVMRWEKVTRLFLRTAEFLWQEGHTVHATYDEAEERTLMMLDVYRALCEDDLAIPVVPGRKSEAEKFAGADRTYSIEALMGDGKALQAGTSHNLGDHFARGFNIKFLDRDGAEKFAYTTSWGLSTRIIGALIMVHGDDQGLILPPKVAPFQVVFVPIWRKETEKADVFASIGRLEHALQSAGVRTKVDWSENTTPGFKFNEWELRGVPLRIEVGPRDVREGKAVLVRRDTRAKEAVSQDMLVERVQDLLKEIQQGIYDRAVRFRAEHTHWANSYDEFKQLIENRGFIEAWWCGDAACETQVKNDTKATTRCIPLDQSKHPGPGTCLVCGKPASQWVIFARAY